jgi:hypothetical protein
MIKISIFGLAVLVTAAAAVAAVAPSHDELRVLGKHFNVIEKNTATPHYGPLVVERCAMEDCSDTPS